MKSAQKYWLKLVADSLLDFGKKNNFRPKIEGVFRNGCFSEDFSEEFYMNGTEVSDILKLLKENGIIESCSIKVGVSAENILPGLEEEVNWFDSQEECENAIADHKESIENLRIEGIDYEKLEDVYDELDTKPKIIGKKLFIGKAEITLGKSQAILMREVLENKKFTKLDAEMKIYGKELSKDDEKIESLIKALNRKSLNVFGKKILEMRAEIIYLI